MAKWLEGIIEPELVPVASWVIIAFIALIVVYVAYRIVRAMTSGAFLMRGRNRKARLAVMDAAAIDDKRRLVLVRRDDVEHLILIGGANDIVVEHDIRMVPKAVRAPTGDAEPTLTDEPGEQRAPAFVPSPVARPAAYRPSLPPRQSEQRYAPAAAVQRQPATIAPAARPPVDPQPVRAAPAPQPVRPAIQPAPVPEPRVAASPPVAPAPRPAPPPASAAVARPAAANQSRSDAELDDALLSELQETLDIQPAADSRIDNSLEDEMTKLLGELSRQRK